MIRNPCIEPTCGRLTTETRCRDCKQRRRRATYEHPDYKAWGRPTGLTCALRIKCNGAPATTWDHIDGDNTNHALSNRQPACGSCNPSKGNRV